MHPDEKMILYVFVHEFTYEIGHSKAMIETINQFPQSKIKEINIVSYECDDLEKIFSRFECKKRFIKVPFKKISPFLFKMIFYHIWTFIYSFIFIPKNAKQIGVGIASLTAKYINVQFVHYHWGQFYFSLQKLTGIPLVYKKILFYLYRKGEDYLYSKKDIKLSILSKFETNYCKERFKLKDSQVKTIYSGINLDKFNILKYSREEIYNDLLESHNELKVIDISKPIFLFVGAYERKGLEYVFKSLDKLDDPQIIIVGSPESKSSLTFPRNLTMAKINFSYEIEKFYTLADAFVFPTIYEPFGLVILEAAALGLELYITRKNVGATELLEGLDRVHIFDLPDDLELNGQKILTINEKQSLRELRLERLSKYNWKAAGEEFFSLLSA